MAKITIRNISFQVLEGKVGKERFIILPDQTGEVSQSVVNVLGESCPSSFEIVGENKENEVENDKEDIQVLDINDEDNVVFLTEDTQHITGGRYYSWWLATAMKAAGFNVVIYTNRYPVFLSEFSKYPQPEIKIVNNLSEVDVNAKFYVGSPVIGSVMAVKLATKYAKTAFCEIFDPFPMMGKYRGKYSYPEWEELIELLKQENVKIISLCKSANKYIYSWLNKKKDQVYEIYPCVNNKERDLTKEKFKKKDSVVFISRLDHHKMLNHCLDAVKETNCDFDVITSVDAIDFPVRVRNREMTERTHIHWGIDDKEKFKIIKQARAVINGAIYEGFGIWMTEALSCGVPVVCYDYETFREIGKGFKNIYYADWNNSEDLRFKLFQALKEAKFTKGTRKFDFPSMVKRVKEVFNIEPQIGVVQICLNMEEFIAPSLRSVIRHKNIEKVAVVEGAVDLFSHAATKKGLSIDNTSKEVMKVMGEENGDKIIYLRYGWASNKSELRNRALELLGKDYDYIMILDADEVWKQEDLDELVKYIKDNPEAHVINYPAYHFWKKPNQIAVGSNWNEYLFRFFKYNDKSVRWILHEAPVVNSEGKTIDKLDNQKYVCDVHFYHYGAMRKAERIKEKLEFYKKRDTNLTIKDTWTHWRKGDETSWTHGGGTVIKFKGTHPEEMKGYI